MVKVTKIFDDQCYSDYYKCNTCGYTQIIRAKYQEHLEITAKYCGGCGKEINWEDE